MTETPRPPVLTPKERQLLEALSDEEHNTTGEAIDAVLAAYDALAAESNRLTQSLREVRDRKDQRINELIQQLQVARDERDGFADVISTLRQERQLSLADLAGLSAERDDLTAEVENLKINMGLLRGIISQMEMEKK